MSWLRTGCLLSRSGGTSFLCASSCAAGASSTNARGAIESLPWHQGLVAQTTTMAGARSFLSSLAPTPSPVSPTKSVGNVCRPSRELGHSSQTSLRSVESPRRRVRPWGIRHLSTTRQVSGESSSQDCHDDDEVPLQLSAEERQLVSSANAPPLLILESTSHDPIFNLSYEDYLFRHVTPAERPILFMYRNAPAVVIGRNQVPWKEVDPERLESEGVRLVRRRSGGGAVYHVRPGIKSQKKKKDGGRQREPLWTPIDDGSCGILTCPPFLPPIHDGSVLPVSVVPPQSRTFPLSPSIQDLGNTNFSILLPRKLFDRSLGAEMVARAIRCGMGIQRATVNERGDVVLKAEEEGAGEGWKKVRGGHVGGGNAATWRLRGEKNVCWT